MKALKIVVAPLLALLLIACPAANATEANTFSGSLFLGDSYAPSNFRLSLGSFDLGFNDIASVYAGSRAWKGAYYAGFGFGIEGTIYGLVGHEWRFLPWLALSTEFDGIMSATGEAAGRVYIGLTAGW